MVLSVFAVSVYAGVIPVKDAQAACGDNVALVYTAVSDDGNSDFYVFNNIDGKGFTVVAADDVVGENIILAYSDEGIFDYEAMPENARSWFEGYQQQIAFLRDTGEKAETASSRKGVPVVAPMLGDLLWGQHNPYNLFCPVYGREQAVTGCLATAMAEVMYYHKWPLQGKGSHSYKYKNEQLSADFGNTVYDWYNMLPSYSDNFTDAQAAAVARLMSDCGVAVDMMYGLASEGGSGAYDERAKYAFRMYFKYKEPVLLFRSNYRGDWDKLVRGELDSKRPVIYRGASADGGHAFVCDGYDSNSYFHFNFGWTGQANGYYLSKIAGGFTSEQGMLYNIIPEKSEYKSDGLYYTMLGNNQVQLVSPDKGSYSGDVVIPSAVVIDSVSYSVTRIGASAFAGSAVTSVSIPSSVVIIDDAAFYGCDALSRVVLDSPVPAEGSVQLFDNDTYSRAVLSVPKGSVKAYSSAFPWCLFCTVTDGGESVLYDAWKPEKDGTGTYTYGWDALMPEPEDGCSVCRRTRVGDADKVQFKIDNWFDTSLLVDMNAADGSCRVPRQKVGVILYDRTYNDFPDVMVTDVVTFHNGQTYYGTSSFDSETGTLNLKMVYTPSNSYSQYYFSGDDKFVIDGYPYYEISIDGADVAEDGLLECSVSYSEYVAGYEYYVLPGELSEKEVNSVAEKYRRGEIKAEKGSGNSFTYRLENGGKYTAVVFALNAAGKLMAYDGENVQYFVEPEWVALYSGTYKYSVWDKITVSDVIYWKDSANQGSYKLTGLVGNTELNFIINDDNSVVFDNQFSGLKYQGRDVMVDNYVNHSSSAERSYFDPLKKIIHFNTYYTDGRFVEKGFETYTIEQDITPVIVPDADAGERVIYNVWGQRLDEPQKGINIINGRKVIM